MRCALPDLLSILLLVLVNRLQGATQLHRLLWGCHAEVRVQGACNTAAIGFLLALPEPPSLAISSTLYQQEMRPLTKAFSCAGLAAHISGLTGLTCHLPHA